MHGQTDRLDAGQFAGEAVDFAGFLDVDAELVFLLAGGDFGMGHRVDIWIYPDRDPGGHAARCRDRAEPVQFGNRLDIDLVDVGGERGV